MGTLGDGGGGPMAGMAMRGPGVGIDNGESMRVVAPTFPECFEPARLLGPDHRVALRLPTPVERVDGPAAEGPLWVKRDDLTNEIYGGNKARKLRPILELARDRGARRLATVGAAGSHHVLATTLFGRAYGLDVSAALVPHPGSARARTHLAAGIALGLEASPKRTYAAAAAWQAVEKAKGAFVVPVGGSSIDGTLAYVEAALELAEQVRAGVCPEPDWIVATLGSGGTVAGLAAGCAIAGLRSTVVGVIVATPVRGLVALTHWLVRRALAAESASILSRVRLELVRDYLGGGYAKASERAIGVIERAKRWGIMVEPVYTAKSLACAFDRMSARPDDKVLFWQTLATQDFSASGLESPAPLAPELEALFEVEHGR